MLDTAAATRLRRQLSELPELVVYAHLALLPGSAPRDGRVSGATRTAPLPCRLDVLSLLGPASLTAPDDTTATWPVHTVLAAWARIIATGTRQCLVTTHLQGLTHVLIRHHPWAIQQPWAADYAAQIAGLHRELAAFGPSRPRRRALTLPCPRCDLLTLAQVDGEDIACSNPGCQAVLRPAEYDQRVERALAEMDAVA